MRAAASARGAGLDVALEAGRPSPLAGVDEAGRGPWAGPVVAAAVILDPRAPRRGLDDSKRMNAAAREEAFAAISALARIGVGRAEVAEIDALNIRRATFLAMARALAALPQRPAFALFDGRDVPPETPCPGAAIIGGDGRAPSIAAASIVAKVTRDRIMTDLAARFPGYGWETNMGYGVPAHRAGLERLGVTPHHRRSFRPIGEFLLKDPAREQ